MSVLSLYEGELLGIVDKLYFDKKLKKLIEIELISEDDVRLLLPVKNIYHVGKNAITVKNNQAINIKTELSENVSCPISSKAYSLNGEYLGIIKEISLDDKFRTDKISLDNNSTIAIDRLASCGKNTVIFYENNSTVNIKRFTPVKTPKEFKTNFVQITKTLPIPEEKYENIVPIDSAQRQNQTEEFLIGRTCTKDIYNFNNELLIKSNSQINKKNLKEIKKFGKLRELMLYCK